MISKIGAVVGMPRNVHNGSIILERKRKRKRRRLECIAIVLCRLFTLERFLSESESDVTSLSNGMGCNPILARFAPCCTGFQLLV